MTVIINNSHRPNPQGCDRTVIVGIAGLFLFVGILFLGLFLASSPSASSAQPRSAAVRPSFDTGDWL